MIQRAPIQNIADLLFNGGRDIQRIQGEEEQQMVAGNLMNDIEAAGGIDTPAGQAIAAEGIAKKYPHLAPVLQNSGAFAKTPYGVTPDKLAQLNNAKADTEIKIGPLDRLEKAVKIASDNTDNSGNIRDENIAKLLTDFTGGDPNMAPRKTLADMLGVSPQATGRNWWDDTISPQRVKFTANQKVTDLQMNEGLSRDDARNQVAQEYNMLQSEDTDTFQKYPKIDVAQLFADQDTRKAAITEGKTVVDTGDGVQTTLKKMADIGINNVNTQEQFQAMEDMVSKALPDMDLRADYQKNPKFYQKLFQTIKEGVPDGKGGKRKLSMQEIVSLIKGE